MNLGAKILLALCAIVLFPSAVIGGSLKVVYEDIAKRASDYFGIHISPQDNHYNGEALLRKFRKGSDRTMILGDLRSRLRDRNDIAILADDSGNESIEVAVLYRDGTTIWCISIDFDFDPLCKLRAVSVSRARYEATEKGRP